MDPDNIELNNLSKSFAYQKLASEIDSCGISSKLLILKTHQTLPLTLQVIRGRVR